ncbi:hypothetical protein ACJX0J_032247, partial [Zea mays]
HGGGRAVRGGGGGGGVVVGHGAVPPHQAPLHRPRRGPPPGHAPAELRVGGDGQEAVAHAQGAPGRRHRVPHLRRARPRPGDHDGQAPGHHLRLRVAVLVHAHLHQRARPGPRRLPLRHRAKQGGAPLLRAALPRPQAAGGAHVAAPRRARAGAVRRLPQAHHRRRRHGLRRRHGHRQALQALRGARGGRGPPRGPVLRHQEVRPHGGQGARRRLRAREPPRRRAAPVRRHGRRDRPRRAHRRRRRHAHPDQRRRARPPVHSRRHQPGPQGPEPRGRALGRHVGGQERQGAPGHRGRVAGRGAAQDLLRVRQGRHRGPRRRGQGEAAQAPGVGPRHRRLRQVRVQRPGARHRRQPRRHVRVLGLGPAADQGRVLPLQGVRGGGRGPGARLRAARRRAVDGDVQPQRGRVHRLLRGRQGGVPRGDARLQPLAVLQLGRVRDDGRRDGRLHPERRAPRLRLAVHHARRVPRRRARHRHVRAGLRTPRHAGLRGEDPEGGEDQRRGDAGASEVVGRQFLRQGAQGCAGWHLLDCSHGQ